jgi:hypothetical protein
MQANSLKKGIVDITIAFILVCVINSCKKEIKAPEIKTTQSPSQVANLNSPISVNSVSLNNLKTKDDLEDITHSVVPFNLNVILYGQDFKLGYIRFRQIPDGSHVITLDTWVFNLSPNHTYLLQRAVDALDYNCTSTTWLTLGKGLTPQSIITNQWGFGMAEFSRNVSAVSSGSSFDIHFQVIDAVTSNVLLKSDCYQYMVR